MRFGPQEEEQKSNNPHISFQGNLRNLKAILSLMKSSSFHIQVLGILNLVGSRIPKVTLD